MKKRVLALLLSACMVLGMAGCSSGKAETASDSGGRWSLRCGVRSCCGCFGTGRV